MILTHLDCSTAHLTRETMEALSYLGVAGDCATGDCSDERIKQAGWPAMTIAAYDKGAFVTIPGAPSEGQLDFMPDDLVIVLAHAQRLGCQLVRFDADGATIDLPTYDW